MMRKIVSKDPEVKGTGKLKVPRVWLHLAGLRQQRLQGNQREQIFEEGLEPPTTACIFPKKIKEIDFLLCIVEKITN